MKNIYPNIFKVFRAKRTSKGNSFLFKVLAVYMLLSVLTQLFYPTVALALTGGPSQPEVQGFEPIGTTNMVDLSSGSFTYNIPLMDIEGYPINLAYHSGVTMDQEASWVGLGWNINPGEINRQMRGLPDDFNGDTVTQSYNMKNNITVGLDASAQFQLFGMDIPPSGSLTATAGIFYNNYKGPGMQFGATPSINSGANNKGPLTGSLGLDFNSQSGLSTSLNGGFSTQVAMNNQTSLNAGINVGTSYNSRSGLKAISMSKDLGISSTEHITSTDKNSSGSGELSSSSSISFSAPSYTPTITMPLNNYAITLQATLGAELMGGHPNWTFSGYYNEQTLATPTQSLPAYGYMYADGAVDNPYALHDFNREKDVPFQPYIANLPITNFTYDLFSINGQGVSGQFRPYRGDVGVLYDHENYNTSLSGNLGVELGIGDLVHNGVNVSFNTSNTVTDKWTGDNDFCSTVDFQSIQPGTLSYEPFYMKSIGEKTVNDTAYYNEIINTTPIRVQLDRNGSTVKARNIFDYSNTDIYVPNNLTKTQRERRNQSTSILSAQEANYFALDKTINSYPYNTSVYGSCSAAASIQHISRLSWPGHHMSEITVTNPDGKRYVYGLPAYNTVQNEATFSVKGTSVVNPASSNYYQSDSVNLVPYKSGDNSTGNVKGLSNYYNEQYIPPYSHSFLLTGVLSPDYVDLTGDGITDDDLGEAVKINYTQVYTKAYPFKWRTPMEQDTANYQIGLMSDTGDDKANYLYGEKEMWYVHSIESKTMVAQFILQDRYDGFGVSGENGGMDTTKHVKCLKEIDLYSKADLIKNGANAVPIKTVHFVYNYSLCPETKNTDNSKRGKLTLTQVYFTYGNNTEGSLNSYQFTYSSVNPNYNHNRYDRWGYYKYNPSGMPPNEDFPYTLQDSIRDNSFCQAWELTNIALPSGGNIKVNYEPNDYAYVQNKRANQMFTILGMGDDPTVNNTHGTDIYSYSGAVLKFHDWVYVSLPTPITSDQDFYNKYLSGIDSSSGGNPITKLYFRFLVNVGNNSTPLYEYVPGYADIASYHKVSSTEAAIKLSEISSGDPWVKDADPVAMASWQFLRLNLPQYAYPGSKVNGSVLSIIEFLFGIIPTVAQTVLGFDQFAVFNNFGKYVVPGYSYVRLDNPSYKKYGGGARVKEIDISDDWSSMVYNHDQSTFQYGQTFNYTTTFPTGQVISSGVATYEPIPGGDENPFRQPLPYDEKNLLAPNNAMYTETPLGENLYPSAGVVYSKVTVTNLSHKGVTRTGTGYTVNEFYTAHDFPIVNNWTSLDVERVKPSVLASIFSVGIQDFTTASQGFTVEVNDMAGKEKSQEIYDQNNTLISSVEYDYHVDNASSPTLHLNNKVQVVNSNGSITPASVGADIDVWQDMREQDTQTLGLGAHISNDAFIVPIGLFPLFLDVLAVFPSYSSEHTRFRSAVTTKYIYRTGLVDKITKMQNGSTATTQNILYDGETGEVLLTKTNNEFEEPIYNFTYPAHWAYDGMGGAYKNIGAMVSGVTTNATTGVISLASGSPSSYFEPGDEIESFGYVMSHGLYIKDTLSSKKGWVTQPQTSGSYVLMDVYGKPISLTNALVKIIRSGRRNMASMPVASVSSMNSPINSSTKKISISQSSNILQASASLYNDLWKIPYTSVEVPKCTTTHTNADTCLAQFLDSLIYHHKLYAKPSDSIHFGKYVKNSACRADSSELYYALDEPTGNGQIVSFQAQLGNCILTISSTSGNPVTIKSLSPYTFKSNRCDSAYITYTNGCLNLYTYTVDNLIFCFPTGPVATACISCQTCHDSCENLAVNNIINPFAQGMLGNWRPERNYVYYDSRSPALASTKSNIWNTGTFRHFNTIWDVPSSGSIWPLDTSDKNWTWTSRISMYDQKGNEVEDVDALGRYSSALYGYVKSLPVAVASNAKFKDIAYDGFEDYGFTNTCAATCDNSHFSYMDYISDTTSTEAHTGKYSLKIGAGTNATVSRSITSYNGAIDSTTSTQYYLLNGGNIPEFSPESGSYLLSAWVKESATCGITGYTKDSIVVSFTGSSAKYSMKPSGPVIEGWQRFESKFNVPSAATAIYVELVAGTNTAYYDDIRIEPFAAEMKTYVYDPSSLRLLATLDENNYATIYEYNDEGILMRVKKETERGIMTIKESRSSYKRH